VIDGWTYIFTSHIPWTALAYNLYYSASDSSMLEFVHYTNFIIIIIIIIIITAYIIFSLCLPALFPSYGTLELLEKW